MAVAAVNSHLIRVALEILFELVMPQP